MKNYDNQEIEIIPNFKYKVAPKDRGLKMFFRRIKQFNNILFSDTFSNYEAVVETTKKRYSSIEEIEFYKKFGKIGLLDEEMLILKSLATKLPEDKSCLVVGCGTGREVFGVEKLGFQTTGVDNCQPMITNAELLKAELSSLATFKTCDFLTFCPPKKYDVVFMTYALLNHIQGKENRIDFLKHAKSLMKDNGYIVMHCDEFPMTNNLRYHIASILLRLRWLGKNKWQKGDTARSFLGTHCSNKTPLFFHYYTSHFEVIQELQGAGLMGWQFRRGWVIKDASDVDLPLW